MEARYKAGHDDKANIIMPSDLYFLLALAVKMAVAAGFVIAATVTAERAGPFIGSLIVTLPISTGPAYVFVALDHPAEFVSRAALTSVVNNVATALFTVAFVFLAQRFGAGASVLLGLVVWLAATLFVNATSWSLPAAIALNAVVIAACYLLARNFRDVPMPRLPMRRSELLFRAVLVGVLVAAVVTLSFHIGPERTGILASFPATFAATMFILQRRVGGPATAAVMAHSLVGLLGFGLCMAVLSVAALSLGRLTGLLLALLFSVSFNASILLLQRQGVRL
jgi:hypothetical protein